MSTIQADRASAKFRRHLAILLAFDEKIRPRGPVSLPGQVARANPPPAEPAPAPAGRTSYGPQHLDQRSSVLAMKEPTAEDAFGAWTRSQLLRMDWRFCQHVERAFSSGEESRASWRQSVTDARG